MDDRPFVQHDARFGFHRDHFKSAQAAMSHGTDAARATTEKSTDGSLGQGGGVHAQFPALLIRFGL